MKLAVTLFALALPVGMLAQTIGISTSAAGDADPFKVNYASNLDRGDSALNFTNTGANGGNICLNLYLFSPDEQMQACCNCTLTPDGLYSAALLQGLLANPAFIGGPGSYLTKFNSAVVKALATKGNCPAVGTTFATTDLAPGLVGWGTHYHITATGGAAITETPFADASLSGAELSSLNTTCNFLVRAGSGEGICSGCKTGGLEQKAALNTKLGM